MLIDGIPPPPPLSDCGAWFLDVELHSGMGVEVAKAAGRWSPLTGDASAT